MLMNEFLATIREAKRCFRVVLEEGRRIRFYRRRATKSCDTTCKFCPVTLVAYMKTRKVMSVKTPHLAGCEIGFDIKRVYNIVTAADWPGGTPNQKRFRTLLLKAAGL